MKPGGPTLTFGPFRHAIEAERGIALADGGGRGGDGCCGGAFRRWLLNEHDFARVTDLLLRPAPGPGARSRFRRYSSSWERQESAGGGCNSCSRKIGAAIVAKAVTALAEIRSAGRACLKGLAPTRPARQAAAAATGKPPRGRSGISAIGSHHPFDRFQRLEYKTRSRHPKAIFFHALPIAGIRTAHRQSTHLRGRRSHRGDPGGARTMGHTPFGHSARTH